MIKTLTKKEFLDNFWQNLKYEITNHKCHLKKDQSWESPNYLQSTFRRGCLIASVNIAL